MIWLQLSLCAVALLAVGPQLSRYADIIADRANISAGWIGVVLLASVTSLPELATGITAVTLADAPNIAIGNALGACVFNLVVLAVLDYLLPDESIYRKAKQGHILSLGYFIVLAGFVSISIEMSGHKIMPSLYHVGLYTPFIIVIYVVAVRSLFDYERREYEKSVSRGADRYRDVTLSEALKRFGAFALVVIAIGIWLPFVGTQLADAMGWHRAFVGTLFISAITTMPEIIVTVSALRMGATDLAIANLLGSNLFDILIIAINDVFYFDGPILEAVSDVHSVSAMTAIIMSGFVVVGFLYRPKGKLFRKIGWISISLLVLYSLNAYAAYLFGT